MTQPILVTGGTGRLGSLVVTGLRDRGHEVRTLSRHGSGAADDVDHRSGDLLTGVGVAASVEGVRVVVHCAGGRNRDDERTRSLVRAASAAGVEHIVNISVIGADRVPLVSAVDRAMFGYFGSKRAAELVLAESGLPWTTLRAAQFHGLFLLVVEQMAKLPLIPVPSGFRFQPVAEEEVAARLVELALEPPAGLVPELAGPRIYPMAELIRSYLRATRKRRLLATVPLPGAAARAMRAGANLNPERAVGRRTWEEALAERVPAPPPAG